MNIIRALLIVALLIPILTLAGDKRKAPDFSLKTADGKIVKLSALKGKVVVVNFWATWCGPCRKEIPDFMDVYKEYGPKGLEIVGIALDGEGWDVVTPFVKKNPITYPIVVGDASVARQWGRIQYIPTTFIVDKEGYIATSHTGLMSRAALVNSIAPLL